MELIDLGNNVSPMPQIGLGLWPGGDSSDMEAAIDKALEIGYRHFDTAYMYQTEGILGKSIKKWIDAGKGERKDLFIVTKLPPNGMRADLVSHFLNLSLTTLGLTYVDLYLIHTPIGMKHVDDETTTPKNEDGDVIIDPSTNLEAIWEKMEEEVTKGKTKAIGLSNFNQAQIHRILTIARIAPVNHQIEVQAYFQQSELIEFCKASGITVTAYSPLGAPWRKRFYKNMDTKLPVAVHLLEDVVVLEIAAKHSVTPGQVLLRYLVDLGLVVIPKTSQPKRLHENYDLFKFVLDSDDFKKIKSLDKGENGRVTTLWKGAAKHPECPY